MVAREGAVVDGEVAVVPNRTALHTTVADELGVADGHGGGGADAHGRVIATREGEIEQGGGETCGDIDHMPFALGIEQGGVGGGVGGGQPIGGGVATCKGDALGEVDCLGDAEGVLHTRTGSCDFEPIAGAGVVNGLLHGRGIATGIIGEVIACCFDQTGHGRDINGGGGGVGECAVTGDVGEGIYPCEADGGGVDKSPVGVDAECAKAGAVLQDGR